MKKVYWTDKPIELPSDKKSESDASEWNNRPHELSFDIIGNPGITELIGDRYKKAMDDFYKKIMDVTEKILREYIEQPIEGELTVSVLKERGIIGMVWNEDGTEFYGIRQRDTLVTIDGKRIPWDELTTLTTE